MNSGPSSTWTLALELSNPTSGPVVAPQSSVAPLFSAEGPSSIAIGRIEHAGTPAAIATLIATERVAHSAPRSSEDDLFPAIERLLAGAKLSIRDLQHARIAVSVGPGGYTGLRIACAAAATLAETLSARCVSVPTALVALHAARAGTTLPSGELPSGTALQSGDSHRPRAVALASKSDSAWIYIDGWPDPAAPNFITNDTAAAFIAEHRISALIADSFLPAPIRAACEVAGIAVIPPQLSAAACFAASATLPDIDPAQLVPLYAREPDAVTQWRERKSSKPKAQSSN